MAWPGSVPQSLSLRARVEDNSGPRALLHTRVWAASGCGLEPLHKATDLGFFTT
jgi:hypothetical protein